MISYTFFFLSISDFLLDFILIIIGFDFDLLSLLFSVSIWLSMIGFFIWDFIFWIFVLELFLSFVSLFNITFFVTSFLIIFISILGFFDLICSLFFGIFSSLTFSFFSSFLEVLSFTLEILFSLWIIWIFLIFFSLFSFINFSSSLFCIFPTFFKLFIFLYLFLEVLVLELSCQSSSKSSFILFFPLSFERLTWLCKITENLLSLSLTFIFWLLLELTKLSIGNFKIELSNLNAVFVFDKILFSILFMVFIGISSVGIDALLIFFKLFWNFSVIFFWSDILKFFKSTWTKVFKGFDLLKI